MKKKHSHIKPRAATSLRSRMFLFIISLAFFLQGCATYHPKPIDRSAVLQGLELPSVESITIQAENIRHLILKPVEIDFRKGLSADDAAIMAVITNPALRAERDRRGIASAQLLQAGILPNPTFSFNLDSPTGGSTRGTVNAYGLSLDWDITSLMTRGARVDAARARAASVALDIAWQEWQVAESAKQYVYRLVFLEEQLSVAKEEEKTLRQNRDSIKKAVSLGDMTILDLEAADAAFQRAHSSVLDVSRQLEQERLAICSILGLPPGRAVPLKKKIELPSFETMPALEEITDGLETRRLDLLALKMGYQSQEAAFREAVLAQFPGISIGPTHSRDTGNVVTTGLAISISLPLFDRSQGRIAVEKATRQQLFDEYIARIFQSRADAARILANIRSLDKQIDAAKQAVESLRKLVGTSYNGFLEGNIDALSYYNEMDKLFAKKLEILRLKQNLTDSYVALEITAGEYLGPEAERRDRKNE